MVRSNVLLLLAVISTAAAAGDFPKPAIRPRLNLVYKPPQESVRSRRDNDESMSSDLDLDLTIDLTHSIRVEDDNDLDALESSASAIVDPNNRARKKRIEDFNETENEISQDPLEERDGKADGITDRGDNTYIQAGKWIAQWDKQYSAWYYFDSETGSSTWDKPAALKSLVLSNPLQDNIIEDQPSPDKPRTERDKPASSYAAPSPSYAAPAPSPSYAAPAPSPSYAAPAPSPSYAAPSPSYAAPAPSYSAPEVDEYGAPQAPPVSSYNPPKPSYGPTTKKPGYGAPAAKDPCKGIDFIVFKTEPCDKYGKVKVQRGLNIPDIIKLMLFMSVMVFIWLTVTWLLWTSSGGRTVDSIVDNINIQGLISGMSGRSVGPDLLSTTTFINLLEAISGINSLVNSIDDPQTYK